MVLKAYKSRKQADRTEREKRAHLVVAIYHWIGIRNRSREVLGFVKQLSISFELIEMDSLRFGFVDGLLSECNQFSTETKRCSCFTFQPSRCMARSCVVYSLNADFPRERCRTEQRRNRWIPFELEIATRKRWQTRNNLATVRVPAENTVVASSDNQIRIVRAPVNR